MHPLAMAAALGATIGLGSSKHAASKSPSKLTPKQWAARKKRNKRARKDRTRNRER